jgi:hypothetical protein
MTEDEFVSYKTERFEKLREYYDKGSVRNKRWHWWFSGYVIVASSVIPVVIATGVAANNKVIWSLLSATVVAATAWKSHAQYHENWLRYRRTWDALNRELALYTAGSGIYHDSCCANSSFVERIEVLADLEGRDWEARNSPRNSGSENKGKNGY